MSRQGTLTGIHCLVAPAGDGCFWPVIDDTDDVAGLAICDNAAHARQLSLLLDLLLCRGC